jgi:hypothetical protein
MPFPIINSMSFPGSGKGFTRLNCFEIPMKCRKNCWWTSSRFRKYAYWPRIWFPFDEILRGFRWKNSGILTKIWNLQIERTRKERAEYFGTRKMVCQIRQTTNAKSNTFRGHEAWDCHYKGNRTTLPYLNNNENSELFLGKAFAEVRRFTETTTPISVTFPRSWVEEYARFGVAVHQVK